MNIFITGGTGFIGGALISRLRKCKHNVIALVRSEEKTKRLEGFGVNCIMGDLFKLNSLKDELKNIDAIIHCAALVTDWNPYEDYVNTNIVGTENILILAKELEIKSFIHLSTVDVFGDYNMGIITDFAPYRKTGIPYVDTKIDAERIALEYYENYKVPITIIRPTWVFGPGDFQFFPEIVKNLLRGRLVYIGNKNIPINLVYIENLVDAILLAMENSSSIGKGFIISDFRVTWEKIINILCIHYKKKEPTITLPYNIALLLTYIFETSYRIFRIKNRPLLTKFVVKLLGKEIKCSVERARKELGYKTKIQFEEAMRNTLQWLDSLNLTP